MTTLCAMIDEQGNAWLCCDQQLSCGDVIERTDYPKAQWVQDPEHAGQIAAIGFSGDPCILAISLRLVRQWSGAFDAQAFAQAIRKELDELGWGKENGNGNAPHRNVGLVLALRGQLFEIDSATAWAEEIPPGLIRAWGSGRQLALGAAFCALRRGDPPQAVVVEGVRAGIQYDIYSGGEALLVHVPAPQDCAAHG